MRFAACFGLIFLASSDLLALDRVVAELGEAKARFESSIDKAAADLLQAFESRLKTTAKTGNLEEVNAIRSEMEAFEMGDKLPASAAMKAAASEHRRATKRVWAAMELAYDKAIRQYTKELEIDKAEDIKSELEAFQSHPATRKRPSNSQQIEIIAAFYGQNISWLDVTDRVRQAVMGKEKWSKVVNTNNWGEPAPGFKGPRTLLIRYSVKDTPMIKSVYEGQEIALP